MQTKQAQPGSFGPVRQLGYVVEDLDAAVDAWTRQLGVGPWLLIRNIPLHSVYLGQPSTPLIDIALSYRGDLQIELIQQRNDAASPYRDAAHPGLHHMAFVCDDIEADLRKAQAQGLRVVCDIRMPAGGRYVYLQSPELGPQVYVEFLENTAQMRDMIAQGVAASAAWDGGGEPAVIDFAAMAGG